MKFSFVVKDGNIVDMVDNNQLQYHETEMFEERAAILEYMDGLSKVESEKMALERVLIRRKIWN